MITLVFLVCVTGGSCFSVSQEGIFRDKASCQATAIATIEQNQYNILIGVAPPHTAEYYCVDWGEPA